MASVHKRYNGASPYYVACYKGADGKWKYKSTKTTDRDQAIEMASGWEKTALVAAKGKLTYDRARELVQEVVADIFLRSNQEELPTTSLREWVKTWTESVESRGCESSANRYRQIAKKFFDHLGAKADKGIELVSPKGVQAFANDLARQFAKKTVRLHLTALRTCFNIAMKQGYLTSNPAKAVDMPECSDKNNRRAFTLVELKKLFEACRTTEWRGMCLFGIYTGQRLGDIALMKWGNVDLESKTVKLRTRKTARNMELPIARPLHSYLLSLPSSDDPDQYLFPNSARAVEANDGKVGTLSNQFQAILSGASLAEKRTHHSRGIGRDKRRPVSELSFHSFRHTATTVLKKLGVPQAVVQEIIGHDSEAVSRQYTHLDVEDLREHVEKMPDVTV